jgi:acyl-CoA thioesterase
MGMAFATAAISFRWPIPPWPLHATRIISAIAQHCHIAYLAPGRLGMRLFAEAQERLRGERSGIYDVRVRTQAGETIAEFRAHSRSIPGVLVPET